MYSDIELTIRPINENDLFRLWELIYKDEQPEWKKWDAPYYPHQSMPYDLHFGWNSELFSMKQIYGEKD